MNLSDIKINPLFETFLPHLSDEKFQKLEDKILHTKNQMVINPLIVWSKDGSLIDGHNRYKIIVAHNLKNYSIKELDFDCESEIMDWMLSNEQDGRDDFTMTELAEMGMKYEEQVAKEAKARQAAAGGDKVSEKARALCRNSDKAVDERKTHIRTDAEVAKKLSEISGTPISKDKYRDMKLVVTEGSEEKKKRMNEKGIGNAPSAIAKEIKDGVPDGYKKCICCNEIKPIDEFKKDTKTCKDCYNAKEREREKYRKILAKPTETVQSKEETVTEKNDGYIEAFVKKSYAPDDYYDVTTRPEKNIQDAIAQLNIIFKDTKTKIMFVLKRYEDILKSQRDRDEVGRHINEFRTEIGIFEHNLMHTTHL